MLPRNKRHYPDDKYSMFIDIHNDSSRLSLRMYPGAQSGMMDGWKEPVKDWLMAMDHGAGDGADGNVQLKFILTGV